ncbi:MAG: tRNA adenosine(34) deaminase TadA [Pseudomonadota bacterium]
MLIHRAWFPSIAQILAPHGATSIAYLPAWLAAYCDGFLDLGYSLRIREFRAEVKRTVIWQQHEKDLMRRALALAGEAEAAGEVAVGALVERGGAIVGEGNNRVIRDSDPSGHAEMVALRRACARLGNYRLPGATLYVTLEPCAMCAGALVHARIRRVVFAAWDPRVGAGGSIINLLDHPHMNHRCIVSAGLLADEAEEMLKNFFVSRRS